MKNLLNNLTPASSLAMSDMIITKGGHYKLTASGGAINFIPKIAYNNKFSLNINKVIIIQIYLLVDMDH